MDLMPKFNDSREAIAVWQCVSLGGDALVAYITRARESAVQAMLTASGESTVRMQGAVKALDELLKKLGEARETADKMERVRAGSR